MACSKRVILSPCIRKNKRLGTTKKKTLKTIVILKIGLQKTLKTILILTNMHARF